MALAGEAAARVARGLRSEFNVVFVDTAGTEHSKSLPACWDTRFEDVLPVRPFRWSKAQGHFPGWWWSSTSGRHVGYESWLERDHAMLLDFDPNVTAYASQPFWLHWPGGQRGRRHAPDFFARRADESTVVVDVRADERIEPADAEAFEAMERACDEVGWGFRRVGALDAVLAANVRWLARYRHPRCGARTGVGDQLRGVFARPTPLFDGVDEVGDRIAVLPVLFHLLWRQVLTTDLTAAPLGPLSVIHRATGGQP